MAAALILTLAGAVVSALWPTLVVGIVAAGLVLVLCLRAPAYGFLAAIALYSFEGSIKMRLGVEGFPRPNAVGAGLLDLVLFASLAALLVVDRGRSLLAVWNRTTRWERIAAGLLAGWLCLSVIQIPFGGDLSKGLGGFRLTQLYVPAVLGGIVVAARLGRERLAIALLAVAALATTYAALRGIIGPSLNERAFGLLRTYHTTFGDTDRNVGSLTSPVALVSFLVPVAVFSLVLGFLLPRRRPIAATLFILAMIGIVASYVRTALVAVVAGVLLLALFTVFARGSDRRRKAYAVGLVLLVLGGGAGAALLAGDVAPEARERAKSLLTDPFGDPSVKARLDTWDKTLDQVGEEPLGAGLGTVGRATLEGRRAVTTDNSYVKILREQGIPGGFLFVAGLLGMTIALVLRYLRLGPAHSPVGVAALAGFVSFLVLMLTGETIEFPGKMLAWTLLGVATWEALGAAPAATPVRGLSRIEVPRRAVPLAATCAVAGLVVALLLTLPREDEYRSSAVISLPTAGFDEPEQAAAVGLSLSRATLDGEAFQERVARRVEYMHPADIPRQVQISYRRIPQGYRYRLTATASNLADTRDLARATLPALRALGVFHAVAKKRFKTERLSRALAQPGLSKARARQLRRRLFIHEIQEVKPTARPGPASAPSASSQPLDELADAVSDDGTPKPSAAWAGLAAALFGAGAAVALLIAAGRDRERVSA